MADRSAAATRVWRMTSDPAPVEPLSVTRFREELARRGGTGRVVVLPDTVHTAALAAAAQTSA